MFRWNNTQSSGRSREESVYRRLFAGSAEIHRLPGRHDWTTTDPELNWYNKTPPPASNTRTTALRGTATPGGRLKLVTVLLLPSPRISREIGLLFHCCRVFYSIVNIWSGSKPFIKVIWILNNTRFCLIGQL